jgi:hypothetical protein
MPFQKGNQLAKGHSGANRQRDPLRQILMSQLHEIDAHTGQEKKHKIVANLIKAATGWTETILVKGKRKTICHEPEAWAIKEIFDRVEGKAPQAVSIDNAKEDATQIGFIERIIVYPEGSPDAPDDDKVVDLKPVNN